jgi:hypothetical protein
MGMRRIVLLLASIALAVIFGSGGALADSPTTKEDCKNGGYAKYGFKNQGQCIKAVNHATPADTTAPTITFTQGPENSKSYSVNEVTFAWSADEQITTKCTLRIYRPNDPGFIASRNPCDSPQRFSGLEEGQYDFELWATDGAGNESYNFVRFFIDRTAPSVDPRGGVTLGEPMGPFQDGATLHPVDERGVSVMFDPIDRTDASRPVTFECRTDAAVVGPLVNHWGECMDIRHLEGLEPGGYSYDVRATDTAGNVSVTTTHFTVAPVSPG